MKTLKIIIALLLLLCMFDMPYGYYQLVRWASLVCFILFGIEYYAKKNRLVGIAMFALAVLFQPFFKIALGKTIWNIVDVAVAAFLLILLIVEQRNNHIVYSKEKRSEDFSLLRKIVEVLKDAGLDPIPHFYISGYYGTSTSQLGPEYVTISFREPLGINTILEPQLKRLVKDRPDNWSLDKEGNYHYHKPLDDYGMQSVSFTLGSWATKMTICHFMQ